MMISFHFAKIDEDDRFPCFAKMMMVIFLFHVKQKKGDDAAGIPPPDCHFQAEFCAFHIRHESGFHVSLCVVIAVRGFRGVLQGF